MGQRESDPDRVTHTSSGVVPFTGDLGGTLHVTTIHKDNDTYTGVGYSREQADERDGEKYASGDKD
jgi:hypothetical protein